MARALHGVGNPYGYGYGMGFGWVCGYGWKWRIFYKKIRIWMDMDLAKQGGVEWVSKFCPVTGSTWSNRWGIISWLPVLTLAGTGGLMQPPPPPCGFFRDIFFVYRSNVTNFAYLTQRRIHGGILGILGSPREPHGPQAYGPRTIDEVNGRRETCFREW